MNYISHFGDEHAMPVPANVWPAVSMHGLDLAAGTLAGPGPGDEREPNTRT
jgi:hypothetical protein